MDGFVPLEQVSLSPTTSSKPKQRKRWLLIQPKSRTNLMVDSGKVSIPLNLMMVGTLAQKHFDIDFVDERIGDKVPEDFSPYDVVAITARTLNVSKAYQIADAALAQGKRVILGGTHPTMVFEEAKEHATSVVFGEVESVWDALREDVENDTMKPQYRAGTFKSMQEMDRPDFNIVLRSPNAKNYSFRIPVLATKGCPVGCNFCTTPTIYGKSFRTRIASEWFRKSVSIKSGWAEKTSTFRLWMITLASDPLSWKNCSMLWSVLAPNGMPTSP